jgi:tetratricopeptide (TPR) repeat protein
MKRIVPFLILVTLFCLGCTSGSKTSEGSENTVDTVRVVKRETFVVPRQELIDAYNQIYENVAWKSLQSELKGKALRDSMMNGVEALKAIVEQEPQYSLAYTLLVQFQYALKQYDDMFATLDKAEKALYDDPNMPALRACILVDMGRDAEADEYFRKAIAIEEEFLEKGVDINRDINLCSLKAFLDSTYSFKEGLKAVLNNPQYNKAEKEMLAPFVEAIEADEESHFDRQEVSRKAICLEMFDLEE